MPLNENDLSFLIDIANCIIDIKEYERLINDFFGSFNKRFSNFKELVYLEGNIFQKLKRCGTIIVQYIPNLCKHRFL